MTDDEIDKTIDELLREGLMEMHVDDSGEELFSLTEKGIALATKNNLANLH